MSPRKATILGDGLSGALLAGEWDPPAMIRRGQRCVNERRVWIRDVVLAVRSAYPDPPRDRPRELANFIAACPPLHRAIATAQRRGRAAPRVHRWYPAPTEMGPTPWPVTPLASVRDVKDLFGVSMGELLWFADQRQLERDVADERLRHYRYRWIAKPQGGSRLLEAPKARLKGMQRVVVRDILDAIPPHPAAHGFRKGRSAVTHAAAHVGHHTVVHLDLEAFFASVAAGRVYGIFRSAGYPEPVAHLLTSLCVNVVPRRVRQSTPDRDEARGARYRLDRHLATPHLPQGAPTSPALANLAAFHLDVRLAALAGSLGAAYSRYADDLAFSGPSSLSRRARQLIALVTEIVGEEGFRVNPQKTSVRTTSQRQTLTGIVVNQRPNVPRREYDELKAILHNAASAGLASQNRAGHADFRAHLLGRIGWVSQLNPERGERLRAALAAVD